MNDDIDILGLVFLALPFIWTLACAVAFGMDIWDRIDASEDLDAKRRSGVNGIVEIVGRGNIRRANIRLYIEGVFMVVGILAMLGTFGVGLLPQIVTRTFSTFAFVSIPIVMSYDRIQDRRNRTRISNAIRQAVEAKES